MSVVKYRHGGRGYDYCACPQCRTHRDGDGWRREFKKYDRRNWKREALEELSMENDDSVFVIINEWEANDEDSLMEIVGGRYFEDEDLAWERLDQIAESYGVDLPAAENSFEVPSENTYETYYIMELVSFDEAA